MAELPALPAAGDSSTFCAAAEPVVVWDIAATGAAKKMPMKITAGIAECLMKLS
jgi:hypothetical protein